MLWTVPALWKGGECWIIGGGTSMPRQFGVPESIIKKVTTGAEPVSAYSPFLSAIHNKHVIGVNNAYKLGPWIDACFFGDCSWYVAHRLALAKFDGLKITCCIRFAARAACNMEGIKYLAKDKHVKLGISENPSTVAWNHNSGGAAISVAAHFGAKRIILLGFDMSLDKNSVSHWHGSHHMNKKSKPVPPFKRHLRGFPDIAKHAKKLGIEILNASPNSVITEFKKVTVNELLQNTRPVVE